MRLRYNFSLAAGLITACSGAESGSGHDDAAVADAAVTPIVCEDDAADIYAIDPASVADAAPGEVLACARLGALTRDELDARITAEGVTVSSGAERFLVAYRTERQPGVAGVGSGLLLVPDTPRTDAPVVVVNHGTAGHADGCAPSRLGGADTALVLPWVASGLVTMAVDYAGLGTAGVQGYGDAFDTAQSVLDGARAALRYLREARPIVITGHSQGGAATLFAQGLAPSYAPDLTIERAISFAGGSARAPVLTPMSARLLGGVPISGGMGVNRAIFAMLTYADFANRFGEVRAGDGFHPSVRETIVTSMENDCIFAMASRLAMPAEGYVPPNDLAGLLDPALLTAVSACVAGRPDCTPEGMAFVEQRTTRSFIPIDAKGGDILLISGTKDTLHAPTEFACVLESMEERGASVESCLLMDATHFDITSLGIGTALKAVLDGTVTCPLSATPAPACAP